MGWIANLLGAASKEDLQGLRLGAVRAWSVSGLHNLPQFLRVLPDLLPECSILYLEGTSAPDIIDYLKSRQPSQTAKIALGTIWPKPACYHMPITRDNVSGLADLAQKHAKPEVCFHLHVYNGERILLEWHDAFDLPLRVSPDIDEPKIQQFCSDFGCNYTKEPEA